MNAIAIDQDRLTELRETFRDGAGLSIRDWARHAKISDDTLAPGYRGRPTVSTMRAAVAGAAELLKVEERRLWSWLAGNPDPSLNAFFKELRAQASCRLCGDRVPRSEELFDANLSLCIPCRSRKARERYAAKVVDYGEMLVANLAKIKAKSPGLAVAVTVAAKDRTRAVTYARLAKPSGLTSDEVRQILAELDLLKPRKSRRSVDACRPASGGG